MKKVQCGSNKLDW